MTFASIVGSSMEVWINKKTAELTLLDREKKTIITENKTIVFKDRYFDIRILSYIFIFKIMNECIGEL